MEANGINERGRAEVIVVLTGPSERLPMDVLIDFLAPKIPEAEEYSVEGTFTCEGSLRCFYMGLGRRGAIRTLRVRVPLPIVVDEPQQAVVEILVEVMALCRMDYAVRVFCGEPEGPRMGGVWYADDRLDMLAVRVRHEVDDLVGACS